MSKLSVGGFFITITCLGLLVDDGSVSFPTSLGSVLSSFSVVGLVATGVDLVAGAELLGMAVDIFIFTVSCMT